MERFKDKLQEAKNNMLEIVDRIDTEESIDTNWLKIVSGETAEILETAYTGYIQLEDTILPSIGDNIKPIMEDIITYGCYIEENEEDTEDS